MIRVRTKTGKIIDVEEPLEYVEILDASDNLALVFYSEKIGESERVNVLYPGLDEEAEMYARIYKLKWSPNVKCPWLPEPEPTKISVKHTR
tara:strand:+ start:68 stop:340 length:273 start_codon:yes stop_codon:yes gene_type:complete